MQRQGLVGDEFDYGGGLVELGRLLLGLAAAATISKCEAEKAAGAQWLHQSITTRQARPCW